jgi:hypothetical protein
VRIDSGQNRKRGVIYWQEPVEVPGGVATAGLGIGNAYNSAAHLKDRIDAHEASIATLASAAESVAGVSPRGSRRSVWT